MKREILLSYLAGVMDSDGYFTIRRESYGLRIRKDRVNPDYYERVGLKQTSPLVIDLIKKYFGGYRSIQKPNAKNGKPLHSIELSCLKAHKFVKEIYPYLKIKKKQAKILFKLREKLKEPKKEIRWYEVNNRWGQKVKMHYKCWSIEQIKYFEKLRKKIKSLNDSRNDKYHEPKPFKRKEISTKTN
jgi:hypothetical protein